MKTAFVTGASSGFGRAICRTLVAKGYRVIGGARRLDKLQALEHELGDNFIPLALDVTDGQSISAAVAQINEAASSINVLVNNAGLALGIERAPACSAENWQRMIDTNITGLAMVTHAVLPQMVEADSGMIINMGSIAGTYPYPGGNVYGASKAFVRQFSLNLRADLAGTRVRVSNIEPGLCSGTDFSVVRLNGDLNAVDALYRDVQAILPEDIAATVAWIAEQPPHVNINTLEIMPVAQSSAALNVARNLPLC
ncbi:MULTISPECIES: SDR family NAD(P)-dependent oxidoreductase [Pseudomonas]|jgi:3-hydroxy acid dehydrogenase/malonic semialdehyde reductase|uniref:Oxidoreductase n=1 Tax=Pseudomonas putida NBRC 14164 TaxID=1211579 RepID=A0ABM7E9D0_PSEPU|nr:MULTISPECIES: SDR family NAD(P)-dependent oxidoreductase [Pseudomonas]EKT4462625.1 SDR family NAD(P)-dependent oxidoreductase [Pseudomonas putida]EKT4555321.1 SDR family NAD(P)-dependent oxidoreductase [Pseudomonas putida]ELF6205730.1 SDR family NAD(P)-dependent oxidoreductase [Pseudomonas putida]MCX9136092.1 SDR family NAD(P)-dependent oxidoreductase [Pseudomonas sp. DCB_PUT]MDD1971850.1 SDR family NAD(P)-dependent oxidoreductase [Pseudomonas putida]